MQNFRESSKSVSRRKDYLNNFEHIFKNCDHCNSREFCSYVNV